jgi:hypothetical protein
MRITSRVSASLNFSFARTCSGGFFTSSISAGGGGGDFGTLTSAAARAPTSGSEGQLWARGRTTDPRGPRGAAHARWRGGSAAAGRREADWRAATAAARAAVAVCGLGDGLRCRVAGSPAGTSVALLLRCPLVSARPGLALAERATPRPAARLSRPRAAACTFGRAAPASSDPWALPRLGRGRDEPHG